MFDSVLIHIYFTKSPKPPMATGNGIRMGNEWKSNFI